MSSRKDTGRGNAPLREQQICIGCGFCCDGTLFRHAGLNPGERGKLPEKIEEVSFSGGEKEYFMLPCPYFKGKCSIYGQKRADVCSAYRCQLLKDMAEKIISAGDAAETVERASLMRRKLIDSYRKLTGNSAIITFRQLLEELNRINMAPDRDYCDKKNLDILTAECNIFEALLVKHFRSSKDFDNLIMKSDDK